MRDSGARKRRRTVAPGRIPLHWAARPTRRRTLWPPRYRPLVSLNFVPFQGGRPSEETGARGGPSISARTDKTLPFEWNGYTFDWYTCRDQGSRRCCSCQLARGYTPGEPPIPPPLFGRPRSFVWHQTSSRSRGRRGTRQVFPRRSPAPPWTPGPLAQDRPDPYPEAVGSSPSPPRAPPSYRPRDHNPRIPRKENKAPAGHMHLPPVLAMANKLPSPTTTTHVPGHPPVPATFRNKNSAAVVPLPSSLRAAFGADDCCALAALSKRNEVPGIVSPMNRASRSGGKYRAAGGGNMTVRLSHHGGLPESDALGAKPKKPPRINNSPSERSGGNAPHTSGNMQGVRPSAAVREHPPAYIVRRS
ncbi:WAS/WASL-interacting protein family member 1-like [Dermacentor silvarum]|uniref:WAS/WASL-interacting protein family member 1-like n=1 Tax=Dermacentor silvarum TaxID=543639 RepID=UPI001897E2E0|nr:WAS/WASL-interacting protein family member 1-like [Dermacentor silvarum]